MGVCFKHVTRVSGGHLQVQLTQLWQCCCCCCCCCSLLVLFLNFPFRSFWQSSDRCYKRRLSGNFHLKPCNACTVRWKPYTNPYTNNGSIQILHKQINISWLTWASCRKDPMSVWSEVHYMPPVLAGSNLMQMYAYFWGISDFPCSLWKKIGLVSYNDLLISLSQELGSLKPQQSQVVGGEVRLWGLNRKWTWIPWNRFCIYCI